MVPPRHFQGIKYRSGYPAPCDIIAFTYLRRLAEGSSGLTKVYLTAQVTVAVSAPHLHDNRGHALTSFALPFVLL